MPPVSVGVGVGPGQIVTRDPDLLLDVRPPSTVNLVDGSALDLDLPVSVLKGYFDSDGLARWINAQGLAPGNGGFGGHFSPGYVVKNAYWSQPENWTAIGGATAVDSGGHTIAGVLAKRITGQTANWHRLQFHYDPDIAAVVTIQAFVQDGSVAPKLYCYDVDASQSSSAIIDVGGQSISPSETAGTFGTPNFREVPGGVVMTIKYTPNNVGNIYTFALMPNSSSPADYCLVAGALVADGDIHDLSPLNSQAANAVRYSEGGALSRALTAAMQAALAASCRLGFLFRPLVGASELPSGMGLVSFSASATDGLFLDATGHICFTDGVNSLASTTTIEADTVYDCLVSADAGTMSLSVNGAVEDLDTYAGAVPFVTDLSVAEGISAPIDVDRVRFWRRA